MDCATMLLAIIVLSLTSHFDFVVCDETASSDDSLSDCFREMATCFTDVQDDLRLIFDPTNHYAQSRNHTLLIDLCSAWDDSLSCMADIVQSDCPPATGTGTGTANMDVWIDTLQRTRQFVCSKNGSVLDELFRSVDCFNIVELFECTEKTVNLTTVQDLMATTLDVQECRFLRQATKECTAYVADGSCSQDPILNLYNVLDVFFESARCNDVAVQPVAARSSLTAASAMTIVTACTIVSIVAICK